MKKNFTLLSVVMLITTNLFSQVIDPNSLPSIPSISYVASNPSADTVILAEHGGPTYNLDITYFNWFHNIPTMSLVYIAQHQQIVDLSNDTLMTPADATAYDDTTTAILQKAILYYKAQGKVVATLGHSFGALTSLKYLDNYGINDVDKMIIMAGRLKFDTIVSYAFFNGYQALFDANGQNPTIDYLNPFPANMIALGMLSGGMALPNHLDSLQGIDMTKLFFQYGTIDDAVGTLTQPEIDFLNNANATILEIPGWGHLIPDSIYLQQMVDFIRTPNTSTSISESPTTSFNIFFNSKNNLLHINGKTNGQLVIYDVTGKIIYKGSFQKGNNSIQFEPASKGIYLVNILSQKENYTKKIMVE